MKIQEVLSALEQFAPLPLQESWDNAGLQVGLTEAEVSGALLCLDVTEKVVDEALAKGCNLIVSHHPLLFRGLKTISDMTDVQRTVRKAIQKDIAVVSMHTNMDNAEGGVNHKMAEKLGLKDVQFMAPKTVGDVTCGSGIIGTLETPLDARTFVEKVKATFGVACAMTNELLERPVSRVALCGGAGLRAADTNLRHRPLPERAVHHRGVPRHHWQGLSGRQDGNSRDKHQPDTLSLTKH